LFEREYHGWSSSLSICGLSSKAAIKPSLRWNGLT
jgi:hypothetical protein